MTQNWKQKVSFRFVSFHLERMNERETVFVLDCFDISTDTRDENSFVCTVSIRVPAQFKVIGRRYLVGSWIDYGTTKFNGGV